MTKNISPKEWEALSAYLDKELNPKEQVRLEARLKDDRELRAALNDLRQVRAVLRGQPKIRAPRNFTLTPEMAGIRKRNRPSQANRAYPFLRLASALATFLFVLVVIGDFIGVPAQMSPKQPAAAPMSAQSQAMTAAPPGLGAAQAAQIQSRALAATRAAEDKATLEQAENAPEGTLLPEQGPPAIAMAPNTPQTETPTPAGTPSAAMGGRVKPIPLPTRAAQALQAPAATVPAPYPSSEQPLAVEQAPQAQATIEAAQKGVTPEFDWRLLEVILALIAIGTGLASWFLRRAS